MNSDPIRANLESASLVLVCGARRSGVSLVASQLAATSDALLLQGPGGLGPTWVRSWLKSASPPEELRQQALRTLVDIHGPTRLQQPVSRLILPVPELLQDADLLQGLLDSPRCNDVQVVLMARNPADLICSIARFPHLEPGLPDPRTHRDAFLQAAQGLLAACDGQAARLQEASMGHGLRCHSISYEELVIDPWALSQLRARLGLPARHASAGWPAGISPSLCFRERPLDTAGLNRSRRQLSASEARRLNADLDSQSESTPAGDLGAPLILTGRGGSGTRLLADAVIAQGISLGRGLNASSDSVQWADLLYEMALARLEGHVQPWSGSWSDELRHRARCLNRDLAPGEPWGFKLPEAMLVIDALLDAWPEAKLVHLVRHPLDTCLRRTHMTSRTTNPVGRALLREAYAALDLSRDVDGDPPHLRNAVSWWYQLDHLKRAKARYPERIVEVRYEDLCDSPQTSMNRLMQKLDRKVTPLLLSIDATRRRRWNQGDARIGEVWTLCGSLAEEYGYTIDG